MERHNTHILSLSSIEDQNKQDKISNELKLSIQQESENNNIDPINKITIKDLFNSFNKRKNNQIVQLDENEEELILNEEEIKYLKNMKKKNSLRKNISQNLKSWIDKKKLMKEIYNENLKLIENKTDDKDINNEDSNYKNDGTQTDNRLENNNIENGANEENNNNSKTSNIDSEQVGNPSNRTNSKNNRDVLNTNRENKKEEELDKQSNKEINEANNDNNINENNENTIDNDLDISKKQNKKYKESTFNFYVLNNQNEDNQEIKSKLENNNNFNSSEESININENNNDTTKIKEKECNIPKKVNSHSFNKNNIRDKSNNTKKSQSKKDKSKSSSKSYYKENKYGFYSSNNNYCIRSITKENNSSLNKKIKSQSMTEKNNKIINIKQMHRKNYIPNKKEMSKFKNSINQFNRNKLKTSGNISTKNKNDNKLLNFENNKINREPKIPISRKCFFTKKLIQMDKEQFKLLNEKIKMLKEKNRRFLQQNNEYNSLSKHSNYLGRNEFFDEFNDSEDNNNQRTYINNNALNNYMNKRIISPSILINRHLTNLNNKKKDQKKLTDTPLSPYLINKYNVSQRPLNKSNSTINFMNICNKPSYNKFPNIMNNHNSLKSQNANKYSHNNPNDLNFNFLKSNTIFNFNPKNNAIMPTIKGGNSEEIKTANIQRFQNSNYKSFGLSTPISTEMPNKINLDRKYLQNAKKLFHAGDKGYGRHFGTEKDCPICQSMLLKSNYNMKNMINYHEFIKKRDQNTIKYNKMQFLQELKKPSTNSQKIEANIMKEIKQFLNYSKKNENMYNKYKNDSSAINAYFL